MLSRLCLDLVGRGYVRNKRKVDVQDVFLAEVVPELPYRLQKRQAFDIAYSAAYLYNGNVSAVGYRLDPALYLVSYVRHNLNGTAEIIASPFFRYDGVVDLACRKVVAPGHSGGYEPLVVAEVKVCLSPVIGHKDLSVLERAHRSWVDVYIRVELLDGNA